MCLNCHTSQLGSLCCLRKTVNKSNREELGSETAANLSVIVSLTTYEPDVQQVLTCLLPELSKQGIKTSRNAHKQFHAKDDRLTRTSAVKWTHWIGNWTCKITTQQCKEMYWYIFNVTETVCRHKRSACCCLIFFLNRLQCLFLPLHSLHYSQSRPSPAPDAPYI